MKRVTVYTTQNCPYCLRAKQLLHQKAIPFTEVDLSDKPEELTALKQRSGLRTVPQIFFDEELIGGFTDLLSLETSGTLQAKLR